MNVNKLSQDELDQLDFDGDLTAPDYDAFNMHGNLSVQLPGGATALCAKVNLENSDFFVYGVGSLGPTGAALGGGTQYQSQDFFVQVGGGGGTNQGNIQIQTMRTF